MGNDIMEYDKEEQSCKSNAALHIRQVKQDKGSKSKEEIASLLTTHLHLITIYSTFNRFDTVNHPQKLP